MPSLQEIQKKVKHAQEEIKDSKNHPEKLNTVRHVLWPDIKGDLGQPFDNIGWPVRRNIGFIIHKRLDEQDLQGGAYPTIDVGQLKIDLEAGRVQATEPAQVHRWLPY